MYEIKSTLHLVEGVISGDWAEQTPMAGNRHNIIFANADYRELDRDPSRLVTIAAHLGDLTVACTRRALSKRSLDHVTGIGNKIDLSLGQWAVHLVPHDSLVTAASRTKPELAQLLEETFEFPNLNDTWLLPVEAIYKRLPYRSADH